MSRAEVQEEKTIGDEEPGKEETENEQPNQ